MGRSLCAVLFITSNDHPCPMKQRRTDPASVALPHFTVVESAYSRRIWSRNSGLAAGNVHGVGQRDAKIVLLCLFSACGSTQSRATHNSDRRDGSRGTFGSAIKNGSVLFRGSFLIAVIVYLVVVSLVLEKSALCSTTWTPINPF